MEEIQLRHEVERRFSDHFRRIGVKRFVVLSKRGYLKLYLYKEGEGGAFFQNKYPMRGGSKNIEQALDELGILLSRIN